MNEHDKFQVVVNVEGQYSVWPVESTPPLGWTPLGIKGSRDECLGHIDQVWTDLRPISARPDKDVAWRIE